MLAFHGFGGTHRDFEPFLPALTDYTVYSFDLWHHGESEYEGLPIEKHSFDTRMQAFLAKHKIFRFSLLGYSMGGRICLEMVEHFPGKIDEVWLFAPDGLRRNWLYRFSTRTLLGNYLFRRVNSNPGIFFRGAEFLAGLGLLDKKIKDFVVKQMGSKERREKVYNSWRTTSRLWPELKVVADHLVRYKIKISIVMGNKDKVIRKEWARKLTRYMPDSSGVVKVVEAGHKLQTEEVRKEIWGI
ncbi:MAG: alpha/beta hydrolase [Bacteroidia bacterium]|nr:alpha/beta hydrolase [Bacteroidia bacterium]